MEQKCNNASVEVLPAALGPAQAPDLLVLDGELVVVGDLLPGRDRLLRVDHDLLLLVHGDDFGVAVGLKIKNGASLLP